MHMRLIKGVSTSTSEFAHAVLIMNLQSVLWLCPLLLKDSGWEEEGTGREEWWVAQHDKCKTAKLLRKPHLSAVHWINILSGTEHICQPVQIRYTTIPFSWQWAGWSDSGKRKCSWLQPIFYNSNVSNDNVKTIWHLGFTELYSRFQLIVRLSGS